MSEAVSKENFPPPTTLGQKQELFSRLYAEWTLAVLARGYRIRQGEVRILERGANGLGRRAFVLVPRSPNSSQLVPGAQIFVQDAVHKTGGCHGMGLAADPQLFLDGIHLTTTEAYTEAGELWESLHPLCRWGGRWGDGNHISITHNGVK